MTDAILRAYSTTTSLTQIPFPYTPPEVGAMGLLDGEAQGFAFDATTYDASANPSFPGGTVAVIDTTTPANDLDNVGLDESIITDITGASPKFVYWNSAPYVRWTPHNLFLNSGAPATQNVTLVTGFVYTYGITGTGSLAGSSGASGTATAGSPVTFTATGTTGTFTVSGSPTTMWINRGSIQVPYLPTTGSIRIGVPQGYDPVGALFGMQAEQTATNRCLQSEDFTTTWASTVGTAAVTSNSDVAPDGTTTADTITDNDSGALEALGQSVSLTNGIGHNFSIFVKKTTSAASFPGFRGYNGTTGKAVTLNTDTGVATGRTSEVPTYIYVDDIGTYWRVGFVFTSGSTTDTVEIYPAVNTDGSATWSATTTGSAVVWGAMVEECRNETNQNMLSSYVPTLTASVTRADDDVQVDETKFPNMSAATHSLFVYFRSTQQGTGGGSIFAAEEIPGDDAVSIEAQFSAYGLNVHATGNAFDVGKFPQNSNRTPNKMAYRLAPSDACVVMNNDTIDASNIETGHGANLPIITRFRLLCGTNLDRGHYGYMYQLMVVPRTYSNAELGAITT